MPTEIAHNLAELQAAEQKWLLPTYERNPILFTRGSGVHLYDQNGDAYLDMLSGIGVCALGYDHPVVTKTISEQAHALLHTSNLFFHEHTAELAQRLTEISGLEKVFFCNSGTEAWEAALKLARAHAALLRSEGQEIGNKILAVEHSFHGRTIGSVSTTHKAAYRDPFGPLLPDVEFVPFNDSEALRTAFNKEVCAIAFEVLQGEGGINLVSAEFLQTARELCDSSRALLLLDEIQSGLGRTGRWMAYQHFDIFPDVTTLAKPLANGVPVGAMLCTAEAGRAFRPGMHGTTFGGNPLACAVAISVVDVLRSQDLVTRNKAMGEYFRSGLCSLKGKFPDLVRDVRGLGLMVGLELVSADLAKALLSGMLKRRVLINRTHETVLRFLPPFVIEERHVNETLEGLAELLQEAAHSALATTPDTGAPAPEETVHG